VKFVVHLKEPQPSFWRWRKRREYDKKLALMQRIVDHAANAPELEERVTRGMLNLILYGEAWL
jgi:hypothetical protein